MFKTNIFGVTVLIDKNFFQLFNKHKIVLFSPGQEQQTWFDLFLKTLLTQMPWTMYSHVVEFIAWQQFFKLGLFNPLAVV